MTEKLLFAILLGAAGFREIFRQYKALHRIRLHGQSHPWDRWGHFCAMGFGLGTMLIGSGPLFWSPMTTLGWFLAGLCGILAVPIPCGIPIVNNWISLKIIRNVFFLLMGVAFITHSIGLL